MYRIGKTIFLTALLTGALLCVPTRTHAQFVGDTDVSVSISPEIPGAFENVTITLSSFSANLDLANISWSLDGRTVLSGTGKKAYSTRTGQVGSTITIEVSISASGVPPITKRIVIQPLETDLLWEAVDSHVPPFYKGKALLPSEGLVKVVAIPNIQSAAGIQMKPNEFTYTWNRNYETASDASGYAKNYFVFRNSYLNDGEQVRVTAASAAGNYRVTKGITLSTVAPKILFYENDPALGISYTQAVDEENYLLVGFKGTSLIAEPYYFSPKNALSGELSYRWSVNDRSIEPAGAKNILSIRPEANGIARIGVTLENVTKLFQTASKTVRLNLQTNE